jgi:hypothetical protein
MSHIDNATLCLSRRDLSALAKNLQKETDLSHAKILDAIATAAGYAGGNALMGSLKNAESEAVKPCAEGKEAGYLYEVRARFISDEKLPSDMSLTDIEYETMEGGSISGPMEITHTPIAKHDLGRLATSYGSTPDFFLCFSEEDED